MAAGIFMVEDDFFPQIASEEEDADDDDDDDADDDDDDDDADDDDDDDADEDDNDEVPEGALTELKMFLGREAGQYTTKDPSCEGTSGCSGLLQGIVEVTADLRTGRTTLGDSTTSKMLVGSEVSHFTTKGLSSEGTIGRR
jgi:hypothetical protein